MRFFRAGKACAVFFLVFATFTLYLPTAQYRFIGMWDDALYASRNGMFKNGVTLQTLKDCWSKRTAATWHPLTMLSLSVDAAISGARTYEVDREKVQTALKGAAGKETEPLEGFALQQKREDIHEKLLAVRPDAQGMRRMSCVMHIHNALLHSANAAFVFLLLCAVLAAAKKSKAIGAWPVAAAFVAAAFWAWHPLRVENVAWVSERKDVLFVFWYLLGTLAWIRRETEEKPRRWAIGAFTFFVLALLAKPQAATFPVTAALVSFALRGKIRWAEVGAMAALAAADVALAVSFERLPTDSIPNALASFWAYLRMEAWPSGLSFPYFYPRPVQLLAAVPGILLAALLLAGLFIGPHGLSFRGRLMSHRWLLLALGWIAAALAPAFGAAQADRSTYLAAVGLSVGLVVLLEKIPSFRTRQTFCLLAVPVLAALAIAARVRMDAWRSSSALYAAALEENPENYIALESDGLERLYANDFSGSLKRLSLAFHEDAADWSVAFQHIFKEEPFLEFISPDGQLSALPIDDASDPLAGLKHRAKGISALRRQALAEAVNEFTAAARLMPGDGYSQYLLARALAADGRRAEAAKAVSEAQRLLPPASRYRALLPKLAP
jgi:tetratricopeptide (TPR) repeat protein